MRGTRLTRKTAAGRGWFIPAHAGNAPAFCRTMWPGSVHPRACGERILATASELFYREGIRAIGVDTVVDLSGVSKTSLYRLFDSKDALIAAFVAEKDRLLIFTES